MRLCDRVARSLIEKRGRSNYATAAAWMAQAREALPQHDRPAGWADRLDALHRDTLKSLPAARDEFEKTGMKRNG